MWYQGNIIVAAIIVFAFSFGQVIYNPRHWGRNKIGKCILRRFAPHFWIYLERSPERQSGHRKIRKIRTKITDTNRDSCFENRFFLSLERSLERQSGH